VPLDVAGHLHEGAFSWVVLHQVDESLLLLIAVIVFLLQSVIHQVAARGIILIVYDSPRLKKHKRLLTTKLRKNLPGSDRMEYARSLRTGTLFLRLIARIRRIEGLVPRF